jgi:4-hydroxy-tetrahydrodipicolinate synthase
VKKVLFEGSGTALVTPFAKGSVNFNVLGKLIEFQIKKGTDALIVCGTTGESATLLPEERRKIIKYAVKKTAGCIPIIAGSGSNSTEHAVELSKEAQDMGADGLLIVTPYYNKTSQRGLVEHYFYIADRVNIPIIVYNVPSRTGCNILPDTYLELSKHPHIHAVKEASGDISSVAKTISLCGENLHVYSGNDDQIIPMMSLGAKGVISVFANICPEQCRDMTHSYLEGNVKKSADFQIKYLDLINALFSDVNPIPVKEALKIMNIDCGECRMPLTSINKNAREILINALKNCGVIL